MKQIKCPKCGETSGNNWEQCEGSCPMWISPHYKPEHIVPKGLFSQLSPDQQKQALEYRGPEDIFPKEELNISIVSLIKEYLKKTDNLTTEYILLSSALEKINDLEKEKNSIYQELNETYKDENDTVWKRPTAYAYAKACKALYDKNKKLQQLQQASDRDY